LFASFSSRNQTGERLPKLFLAMEKISEDTFPAVAIRSVVRRNCQIGTASPSP
jgi:hypothetical protein